MKKVPKLRFKPTDGGVFPDWEEKTLGDFLEFKNGINADKEQYGAGVKFINVLDILENDYLTYEKVIGSISISDEEIERYSVNYGDILFQRSSETREDVGKSCVYLDKNAVCVFGGFVIRGKRISNYSPVFLNKLLQRDNVRKQITEKSGGSTRYNIGQETLKIIKINLPSLPEQEKIAEFLSAVDEKIELRSQKVEKLKTYKKAVMQKLFSQELRFKAEDGSDYPEWEEKTLGEVCEINPKNSELPTEFVYIDLEAVENGKLNKVNRISRFDAPSRAQRFLKKDDILFQMVRPYQQNNLFFSFTNDLES